MSAGVVAVAVARATSVSAFGQYSLALTVVYLLSLVHEFGVSNVIVRRIHAGDDPHGLAQSALGLKLAIVVGTCSATLGLLALTASATEVELFVIFVPMLVANTWTTTVASLYTAQEHFGRTSVAGLITTVIAGVLALFAVQQGFGIKGAAVCASFGGVLNAVVLLSTAARPFRVLRPRLAGQLTIATAAIPFLILAASNVLYARIDAFMVNGYRGAGDLGLYSAAVRCLDVLQLAPNALAAAMLPRAFRKVAKGDLLHEWLGRILELSSLIATPCIVAVAIAAQSIVTLLFGAAYSRSGDVLALLSVTVLVSMLNSPLTLYFYVEDRARHLIHVPVVMLVFNLAANAIALPTVGIRGAAAATVATELVGTAVLMLALKRHKLGVPLRRLVSTPLTMLCMGVVVIGGARSWPVVSALAFSLVWITYVALRPSTRTMLSAALSKLREV